MFKGNEENFILKRIGESITWNPKTNLKLPVITGLFNNEKNR